MGLVVVEDVNAAVASVLTPGFGVRLVGSAEFEVEGEVSERVHGDEAFLEKVSVELFPGRETIGLLASKEQFGSLRWLFAKGGALAFHTVVDE